MNGAAADEPAADGPYALDEHQFVQRMRITRSAVQPRGG